MAGGVDGGPLLQLTEGINSTFEVFLDKGLLLYLPVGRSCALILCHLKHFRFSPNLMTRFQRTYSFEFIFQTTTLSSYS